MKAKWKESLLLRRLLFVPPIVIGGAVLAYFAFNKQEPDRIPESEKTTVLRTISVLKVDVLPRTLGYGIANPGRTWQVVAEVKGQIVEVHKDLKPGGIIQLGSTVVRIDKSEYQLTVDRIDAEIKESTAILDQINKKKENYLASLELESKSLVLVEKDLSRMQEARRKNAISESALDNQERAVLAQKQSVQSIKNSLNLLPAEEQSVKAAIAVKTANLAQAKIDLKRTVIVAPFDCRIGPVSLEVSQFLASGENLFEADSIDVVEVEAQMALHHIRTLIDGPSRKKLEKFDMRTMREVFNIKAMVRFQIGELQVEWPANFARIRETLDSDTQTLGVVVAIIKPFEKAIPGKRPPPMKGIFCEVELQGVIRPERIVIPRSSVHDGHVYVVDANNRLHRREVEIEFEQGHFAVISKGLSENETLVISDPGSAIENMLVESRDDKALAAKIVSEATGKGDLR